MEFVSVSVKTPEGNKTIGFISNIEELKHALNDIENKALIVLKQNG